MFIFGGYHRLLTKRPILIQSLTTAILFGAGDVIAQQLVEQQGWRKHDHFRTLRMGIFGGIFAGPVLSNWYRFVENKVNINQPFQRLATKVALDQFVFAPFFIAAFFTTQGLFEGRQIQEINTKLSDGYTTALIGNYKIWPAVQFINFYLTPLNYRLMVTNFVALGWNAYLSTVNQRTISITTKKVTG
ncbi:sym-1 [Mycotypha africana]|uniref:sym-1 n=1 Tax=Mycotypha africana TaxID=64632 RepID=UPI0022FFC591|nr:sym-1 [Mycotypha africana]KAI8972040.1 sym-1 [Mycotypha africana]